MPRYCTTRTGYYLLKRVALLGLALVLLSALLFLFGNIGPEVVMWGGGSGQDDSILATGIQAVKQKKRNLTIILKKTGDRTFSIFTTGTIRRFSTGRMRIIIQKDPASCEADQSHLFNASVPCLVVGFVGVSGHELQQCRPKYPGCKVMATGDEFCRMSSETFFDIRGYDDQRHNHTVYLPLGPRWDFWAAYKQKVHQSGISLPGNGSSNSRSTGHHPIIVPASDRKYVYNAIFSLDTSPQRTVLSNLIDQNKDKYQDTRFLNIAPNYYPQDLRTSQVHLHPPQYVDTLLDSTFTLCPAGHNAECYRIWESIEAGSIPVMVLGEEYDNHPCKNSLYRLINSGFPAVFLNSWDQLFPMLDGLLRNKTGLDERQHSLRIWYRNFMQSIVREFEDLFLDDEEEATS